MIGKTISHYRIVEKLGEGGMGVVYKAEDTKLHRHAALKFLPPYLMSDAMEKERFYHEARAASALNHPNITTIYEIGEHEGQLFIAMELVEGRTLKQAVESEPLSLRKVLDVAIQAGEGLAAAHEKGIVHRDIKSENIMLTPKGQAKIMDFGLAKVKGATKLTKTGSTLGTAAYMSPEQAEGEEVDRRSDIFSFGVVLYELLTGKLPFRGEHQGALTYAIVNEDPPPLARYNEKATDELQRIVSKALAKDRDERYQHVDDMLADLRRERKALEYAKTAHPKLAATQPPWPAEEPAPARPPETVEPSARPVPAAAEPPASGAARRPRRRPLKIVVPAAIVAAAVIALVLVNPLNLQIGLEKTAAREQKSIAVIPFTNMSGEKDDEYFSDGITEDIIAQLSNVTDLKVISRTSVMQYKNTSKNVREIARELGVANVLEGSVRRSGNQVRIVAQLIDATNDRHVWAHTYDKELTEIFAIQTDVAQQIASALKAELSPRERGQLAKAPTENVDAYSLYLKGREYYYRYSKEGNDNAITLFKSALELDPRYALAYAGLGDCYAQGVGKWGFPEAWVDSAIAASEKAIAIDPECAEGYKALGLAYSLRGWMRKAIDACEKAVAINPNYHPAVGNIGYFKMALGEYDEAMAFAKRSLALDPMIPYSYLGVAGIYLYVRSDEKAERWIRKALELQPDLVQAQWMLAMMDIVRGNSRGALGRTQKVLSTQPNDPSCLSAAAIAEISLKDYAEAERFLDRFMAIDSIQGSSSLGYVYWMTGRRDEARDLFERVLMDGRRRLKAGDERYEVPHGIARIMAIEGRKAEACDWLQKAIDAGWRTYYIAEIDGSFDGLRGEERYKRMMADVKAKVDEMRKRIDEMDREERNAVPGQ